MPLVCQVVYWMSQGKMVVVDGYRAIDWTQVWMSWHSTELPDRVVTNTDAL